MSDKIIVTCPNCQTNFLAISGRFIPDGRRVRCAKCDHGWFHKIGGGEASCGNAGIPGASSDHLLARRPLGNVPMAAGGSAVMSGGPGFADVLSSRAIDGVSSLFPAGIFKGVFAATIIACAAKFISDQYGAPAMLMALLIGMSFQFMHEDERCRPGIEFTAKTVLRVGVALLGLRISAQMLAGLGVSSILWIMGGVVATICFGLIGARLLSRGWRFGLLTGGAVAICGASAAMAIAAVMPNNRNSETNLTFTVIGVTVLSTIAMILYPFILGYVGLSDRDAGFFIGATIHDVAQVVGAGYTISEETGDVATVVKMFRVAMLAPIVFFASVIIARMAASQPGEQPPLLPAFVVAFMLLVALNSVVTLPAELTALAEVVSRWMLLIAVAAVGMKTSLTEIKNVGPAAITLIVAETLFIAGGFALLMMLQAS